MFSQLKWRLLTGLALMLALAGCVQIYEDEVKKDDTGTGTTTQGTTTALTGEPIKIGVMLPLSGEEALYGLPAQRVAQISVEEINKSGGVAGRPMELVFEDGGCNGDIANKAMNALVSVKKVKIVHGGFCSSETLAAAPIAEENKVVLFSSASSSPKITNAGDFVFRNYPSDAAQGQALAEYANKKGYKSVGILVEEQPYTEGIADAFEAAFQKLAGKAVIEKFAQNASDFQTQITKLQAAKVDAFFVNPQGPVKAGLIVKQLVEAGVKGPFILNDVAIGATKEVVETYKEQVEGSVGAEVPYDISHPDLAKLKESYKKLSGGQEISYLSYMAPVYDSFWITKEALEKVGEDPVKVKEYLYSVKGRKGLAGTLSFDANGDPTPDYRHKLRVVKNGAVEDFKE